jgi:hypothetical protein
LFLKLSKIEITENLRFLSRSFSAAAFSWRDCVSGGRRQRRDPPFQSEQSQKLSRQRRGLREFGRRSLQTI